MTLATFPPGIREVVYQLRAQGLTTRDIAATLPSRFPGANTPNDSTVWKWLAEPEASALVKREEAAIRAIAATQSFELVPLAYDGVRDALRNGDLKSADAGSRVIVNLTRGFIQERVEVTARVETEQADELGAILARHGVRVLDSAKQVSDALPADTPREP